MWIYFDKISIEIDKIKKNKNIILRFEYKSIDNDNNTIWIYYKIIKWDNEIKEFDFLNIKFAFLEFNIKIIIKKILKYLINIINIIFEWIINVYKNIIKIDDIKFI